MPARDPAASPHLPTHTTSQSLHNHGPILPSHNSHSHGAPSNSSFSLFGEHGAPSTSSSPPGGNGGFVDSIARRFSLSSGRPPPPRRDDDGDSVSDGDSQFTQSQIMSRIDETAAGSNDSKAIRDSSNRLASLSFNSHSRPGFTISPTTSMDGHPAPQQQEVFKPSPPRHSRSHLSETFTADEDADSTGLQPSPPKIPVTVSPGTPGPSGLSLMLERRNTTKNNSPDDVEDTPRPHYSQLPAPGANGLAGVLGLGRPSTSRSTSTVSSKYEGTDGDRTPKPRAYSSTEHDGDEHGSSGLRAYLASGGEPAEDTPLLSRPKALPMPHRLVKHFTEGTKSMKSRAAKLTAKDVVRECVEEPIKALPAVILGLLLNVLDGVSYGMILFPANAFFTDFGSLGVSMFFMSCIISQLTFSLGGSIFKGGNGSMQIEAVPFFHILINVIEEAIGDDAQAIIATTMASFAFSAILTGLVFMTLGTYRLGVLIGYFPRHILVGCIGGVGVFLVETGLEVSRGLKEEGFEYNMATLRLFFGSGHALALWLIPLALAILLRLITHRYHHQLIFPAYFFVIPVVFFIVIAIGRWDFGVLRSQGWVFDVGKSTQPWWKFYTLYNFKNTNWSAFWAAMPTQLALVFFGILHVPLNVPALGVSLAEDNVKLDRELIAHGISNLAAGLTGTVPNYLCYVNTVLFYRVGGGSRLSGLMLAAATAAIMFVGPTVIGYLPVMVVGALIFVLGIDLTLEAVWDTRNRVNRMEYITIWVITIGMTIFDFVIGLLLGIILACVFFVVQSSRRRAIRTVFNGSTAKSTVRRPRAQRAFIQNIGSQTCVMKLQGFLFFGTITLVEEEIRKLLEQAKWDHNPIRFLIIDFALVHGLDFSSAEAFVRIQRLLAARDVLMILCGANPDGLVGSALQGVDLWCDREGTRVEVFAVLNDALEWTENAYLTAFYESQRRSSHVAKEIDFPSVSKPPFTLNEAFSSSPRRSHLAKAGDDTLPKTHNAGSAPKPAFVQPLPTLLQTFADYTELSHDFFYQIVPYFTSRPISSGETLWSQGDTPDGLFIIESGSLRATYAYDDHTELVQETMVAGTVAGDLSMLSDTERNATVVAERDAQLWKMDKAQLEKLEKDKPEIARAFVKIVLKVVAEEADVLSSHLIAVLS